MVYMNNFVRIQGRSSILVLIMDLCVKKRTDSVQDLLSWLHQMLMAPPLELIAARTMLS